MKFLKLNILLSLKIVFILANSAGPDEMPHNADLSGPALFAKVPRYWYSG